MKITVKRFAFKAEYTIGRLYIRMDKAAGKVANVYGEVYVCDTLEPRSAHLSCNDTEERIADRKRRYGTVAIPAGTYALRMAMSRKFHRLMPYLVGVRGFEGVMLHPGNYPRDTRGCILPGWNRRVGMVCASRSAFAEIMSYIRMALTCGEEIAVTVREH